MIKHQNNYHILLESDDNYNHLNELLVMFESDFSLTPCIGAELEFYIHNNIDISELENKLGLNILKEKGKNQYEVNLDPSQEIVSYVKYIKALREKIIHYVSELGGKADFSSKPFVNDYGSSMHIHLNFLEDEDIEKYAKFLCYYLPGTIQNYLAKSEDYQRLDHNFMAPTHIAYGGNNRSMLIRIPDLQPKRLEHRLAAANADPERVIYTMLHSIACGLNSNLEQKKSISSIEKIHGNAYDKQYNLPKITRSIK